MPLPMRMWLLTCPPADGLPGITAQICANSNLQALQTFIEKSLDKARDMGVAMTKDDFRLAMEGYELTEMKDTKPIGEHPYMVIIKDEPATC